MIIVAIVLEPKLKGYLNSYFPNEHWVWLRMIYRHRFSERMEMETLRKYWIFLLVKYRMGETQNLEAWIPV